MSCAVHTDGGFRHEALLYGSDDEYLGGLLPFLREAVEGGRPTLVAVGKRKIDLIRDALDGEAAGIRFEDMAQLGRNPARIIPAWHDFARRGAAVGRGLRGIGEPIWAERTRDELVECQRHESLLNLAFANTPDFHLVCPYDERALPEEVLDEARRSHPAIAGERESAPTSGGYVDPRARDHFAGDLPSAPPEAREIHFTADDLAAVRRFVGARAALAGLDRERAADVVTAASELAANSVRHGGGTGTLRVWRDGDAAVCEVEDAGRFADPLVGRREPVPNRPRGFGLWLVNHLCDLVQIRSRPGRNVVRIRVSGGGADTSG